MFSLFFFSCNDIGGDERAPAAIYHIPLHPHLIQVLLKICGNRFWLCFNLDDGAKQFSEKSQKLPVYRRNFSIYCSFVMPSPLLSPHQTCFSFLLLGIYISTCGLSLMGRMFFYMSLGFVAEWIERFEVVYGKKGGWH